MLIVNNKAFKRRFNEDVKSDRAELLSLINANSDNLSFNQNLINYTNQIIASNPNHPHASSIEKGIANIDDIERFTKYYTTAADVKKLLTYVNSLLNDKSAQTTVKAQNKPANNTKKSASGVLTNKTTKADKDAIVDATTNTETDTTSISGDLINKINSLPYNATDKAKILDPLKVSGDVECDWVKGKLNTAGFYHGGDFAYIINVLIILLRGGKIRKYDSSGETEESTSLWPSSSINKVELVALLSAIVDYRLNTIDYNNTSKIYNEFIEDPQNPKNGIKIFNNITGINFTSICKSSQCAGDLSAKIADKVLGPQKLNLLEPGGYNLTEFRKAIIDGINDRTGEGSAQKINPELAKSLIAMVNKVVDETKVSEVSIEDLLFEPKISNKQIKYTYKLDKDEINKEETEKVLNRIMNDFGEVLGPLFLLKYLNGSERVIYGTDYSEAMKDYTIIHNGISMGVSAKSIKGGNAPDIKPALNILSDFITSGAPINTIVDGQEGSITFDQLLAKSYVDNAEQIAEAKGFFEMLVNAAKGSGNATLTQEQLLTLVDYMCGNESYVKYLCSAMKVPDLMYFVSNGFKNNNKCDEFFSNNSYDDLKDIFDKIASGTGSGDRKGFPIESEFNKKTSKSKLGYFISPLIHAAIDKANKVFGLDKKNKNQVDIISAVIRLAFDYKQIYLGVDCSEDSFTITLQFNQMNVGNWKFATKAMMTDPWKQGILMTMTH